MFLNIYEYKNFKLFLNVSIFLSFEHKAWTGESTLTHDKP